MDVEIISRPEIWVVGLHYRGTTQNEELPALWRKFWPRHTEIEDRIVPGAAYGVIDNHDPSTNTMDYWAGVAVTRDARVPKGMTRICIPAQAYAVVQCTLPTLMQTIDAFYREWLPASNYVRSNGPEFELYDDRFDIDRELFEMSIWIPINET